MDESCIYQLFVRWSNKVGIDYCDLEKATNKHQEEIIAAYEQGYREGQEDSILSTINKDVSEFSNGKDYYNNTFKN